MLCKSPQRGGTALHSEGAKPMTSSMLSAFSVFLLTQSHHSPDALLLNELPGKEERLAD